MFPFYNGKHELGPEYILAIIIRMLKIRKPFKNVAGLQKSPIGSVYTVLRRKITKTIKVNSLITHVVFQKM